MTARATILGTSVALTVSTSACTERLIRDRICGDGFVVEGEVCLGQGQAHTITVETLAPLSIRVADFDGGGVPDLMVMGIDDTTMAVAGRLWRGDGQGSFGPMLDPGVTGCSAHPVPGSIDDDGIDDLLVDDCEATVSLFRGTASGVFEPPLTVATGARTSSSGLRDLDADGLREVVLFGVQDPGIPVLSIAEREPSGSFAPPVLSEITGLPADFSPDSFGIFDFDGDPYPDALLVHGTRPEGLAVARGLPDLRFAPAELASPPGVTPRWATPRDLDGDGDDEVLMAEFDAESLIVFDVVEGTLIERASTTVPGLGPDLVALADLDVDGDLDFIRVLLEPKELHAWLFEDDGHFSGPTRLELDGPVDQLALADLDGDRAPDLVIGSFEQSVVRVLLSDP